MIKFISQRMHGVLDWATVGMLPVIPRVFGWSDRVTRLHDMSAVAVAGSSALTDYPAGIVKVMPMKAHLALDDVNGALFIASAAVMSDEPDSARVCMAATGLFMLLSGLCTRSSPQEQAPGRCAYARQDPIQRYAKNTRPDIYQREPVSTSGM